MAVINAYKFRITNSKFAYITNASGGSPFITSNPDSINDSAIISIVSRYSEAEYKAHYENMTSKISNDSDGKFIDIPCYDKFYHIPCVSYTSVKGDKGDTGSNGEKGFSGEDGSDGAYITEIRNYVYPGYTNNVIKLSDDSVYIVQVKNGKDEKSYHVDYSSIYDTLVSSGVISGLVADTKNNIENRYNTAYEEMYSGLKSKLEKAETTVKTIEITNDSNMNGSDFSWSNGTTEKKYENVRDGINNLKVFILSVNSLYSRIETTNDNVNKFSTGDTQKTLSDINGNNSSTNSVISEINSKYTDASNVEGNMENAFNTFWAKISSSVYSTSAANDIYEFSAAFSKESKKTYIQLINDYKGSSKIKSKKVNYKPRLSSEYYEVGTTEFANGNAVFGGDGDGYLGNITEYDGTYSSDFEWDTSGKITSNIKYSPYSIVKNMVYGNFPAKRKDLKDELKYATVVSQNITSGTTTVRSFIDIGEAPKILVINDITTPNDIFFPYASVNNGKCEYIRTNTDKGSGEAFISFNDALQYVGKKLIIVNCTSTKYTLFVGYNRCEDGKTDRYSTPVYTLEGKNAIEMYLDYTEGGLTWNIRNTSDSALLTNIF